MSSSPELAAQVQQKYAQERDKRIRSEGLSQYIDLSALDRLKHGQEDPWIGTTTPEVGTSLLTDGSYCKYLVIGAGYGGLLSAVRLLQAGIALDDIRMVDPASGYGGTWYWNRYPGLMCDVESYCYMPLLEEMNYMPKHKYSCGPELRAYAESIADKWNLRNVTQFRTSLKSTTWDDNGKEWVSELEKKSGRGLSSNLQVRSQFVIMVPGFLASPHLPKIPGLESFKGHSFHTSRWDYAYTGGSPTDPALINLKDKKVGIIGTGATAVQVVPELAKWAKELYVFQRTPSSVDIRDNRPTDSEWWNREVNTKKGWQRERNENLSAHLSNVSPLPVNLVDDQWSKIPSYRALVGGPNEVTPDTVPAYVASLHALDLPRQERVRSRVDEIVKDKETAEALKPWYPSWCKRPCFHDEYLPSFNLPNVKLIDTDGKGVDRITEHGLIVGDMEFDLDLLIFSTGYKAPFGSVMSRSGISIKGRTQTLEQKHDQGVGTLHGVVGLGFPNLFYQGINQIGATANFMFVLDQLATHIAYIISKAAQEVGDGQQKITIEPTAEAEQAWTMEIVNQAVAFAGVAGCTPSYLNGEGGLDRTSGVEEQMKAARGGIWGQGVADYLRVIEAWRAEGKLEGLEVKVGGA